MFLINLNVLGYNFNLVFFYFVMNVVGEQQVCVVEVQNIFKEMKLFLFNVDDFDGNCYWKQMIKYFYVLLFIDYDVDFDFNIVVFCEYFGIGIDDVQNGWKLFIFIFMGERKVLINVCLLWYVICFFFVMFWIIFLIYWQVVILWFKKIFYYKKVEYFNL